MRVHYSSRFQRNISIIEPGEFLVGSDDSLIATVLGSCVAVVLYDDRLRLGGMNHFMLPGTMSPGHITNSQTGKYGMYAMDLLIREFVRRGSAMPRLRAKVFGGGSVLGGSLTGTMNIAESNILFALEYLQIEKIPIVAQDTGGTEGRKIYLDPASFQIKLKRIGKDARMQALEREESEYLKRIRPNAERGNDVVLF